jgi:SAM-dependent methyltransferase
MENNEFTNIYTNEEDHFYYRTNRDIILSLVNAYVTNKIKHKPFILDAGCGTGFLTKLLAKSSRVIGIDINNRAIAYSRKRNIQIIRASIEKLPFKINVFDAVVSMDVIYHRSVRSDIKAITEIYRVLKPGGIFILRIPAHMWLFSNHDRVVFTKRRYEISDVKRLLTAAGFNIQKINYVNSVLLPFATIRVWIEKLWPSKKPKSTISTLHPWINTVLYILVSKITLPFGIGIIAVAQKPNSEEQTPYNGIYTTNT